MGRSVKDTFKSCLAVSSSCRRSFFHYSRCQSRGPHEDWDQIWYRVLGLLSEMWYQAWYQMWYRPFRVASRSVVTSGTKSGRPGTRAWWGQFFMSEKLLTVQQVPMWGVWSGYQKYETCQAMVPAPKTGTRSGTKPCPKSHHI